ncbi:D-alanyl-D-alanine carboxypeptidase/D-alanyl-D-alanine-endopeptidase [Frigoribacterium sp. UYMn621]|uniref:D-alanyl-D-alanine carboxypeptidase/D-alanyl-D-alanine endopeptidase n=1 Tax=Frigoribacterium sp. UYMn621 TaxID=3156343 RepID=UPI00339A6488
MSDPKDPQLPQPPIDPPSAAPAQPPTVPAAVPPAAVPSAPASPSPVPLTRREARELEQSGQLPVTAAVPPAAESPADPPSAVPPATDAPATVLLPSWGTALFSPSPPPEQPTQLLATSAAPEASAAGAPPGTRGGIFALIAKHPNAWLFSALGVVFALLATGSVLTGMAVGSGSADASAPGAAVGPSATPTPTPARDVPAAIAAATRLRTCSVVAPATDPNLLTFQASVINATTGEVLFDRGGATPSRTASVLKTLTAAAALNVLGPDYQISTKVYAGATPGTVVLVGGGDPTLSVLPSGQESVYRDAPKLSDLAQQVSAASPVPITDIVLDSSFWDPNDNWDPSWERSEQSEGYQPEVTALTVDGGRADPRKQDSPRSSNPIADAGAAFAADLGVSGAEHITTGTAPAGATLLGEVKSRPVSELVAYMLPVSDNTLGEYLARQTSKVAGSDGSSASLAKVIPAALTKYGLTTTGVVIRDGSGLSNDNAVPAAFVAQLMAKVSAGQQNLRIIYDALPIAGKTGTLASRFTGANAVARGAVNAKTGWIKTEYALAGVVHATDGTTLAFAFYALGAINSRTIPALDTITTAVFKCGNNLSNN